jgi:hypothetical protein
LQSLDVAVVRTLAVLHFDEHQIVGACVLDTVRVATADPYMSAGRRERISVPRVTRARPPNDGPMFGAGGVPLE